MTLREDILRALGQRPRTANGLARTLRVDKSSVRRLLLILERRGFVTCTSEKRGKVPYKLWRLKSMTME